MPEEKNKPEPLATRCDPADYEPRWYREWLEQNIFSTHPAAAPARFSMVIPPPNVTGSLHMGHALDITVQDVLLRYKLLSGADALWVPGMDHAGIATQNVVEKQLIAEGKSRQELGREKFVERVWTWKHTAHANIKAQLEKMGAAVDWTMERFTMDEQCSLAVRTAFKALYDEGLIYKDRRIINWCPRCKTALSDIEVEFEEADAALYHIRYPVKGSDVALIVATTRPETMLGDSAVAINPNDPRYADVRGKLCILPLVNREMPIIEDEYVDMEFGTGALKITPAHDPNDFEIGRRFDLPVYIMMDEEGYITKDYPAYAGLDRFEARKRVLADLEAGGFFIKKEPYRHSVGHCYRCHTVIEPYVSLQWFVRMRDMADVAMKAVTDGRTTFIPDRWSKVYLGWLENIRDWCISRQLWWGHRIPVWTCGKCEKQSASIEDLKKCPACGATDLKMEDDVLDTWFSSGLWPLSTLGWPKQTEDLKRYYPTTVLVTGYDIIFFWVARMMMFGLKFGGDVPFRYVYIHGIVRDAHGKKMSKSFGNVIDPLETIDNYGADALRFTLLTMGAMGADIYLSEEKFKTGRNFANKLWNAARYILMSAPDPKSLDVSAIPAKRLDTADRWILSRLKEVTDSVRGLMDGYDLNETLQHIYAFLWHDFCDWYLEMSKERLRSGDEEDRRAVETILHRVLTDTLVLLHPFMPFVTEEIWRHLPGTKGSILYARIPEITWAADDAAVREIGFLQDATRAVRDIRAAMNVPTKKVTVCCIATDDAAEALKRGEGYLRPLAGIAALEVYPDVRKLMAARGLDGHESDALKQFMSGLAGGVQILVPLAEGAADREEELKRLEKQQKTLRGELDKIERKLQNESFMAKAPEDVVEKERGKYATVKEDLIKVEERLQALGA